MSEASQPGSKSQLQLLKQKRFAPFFLTQFFGAFNDNVFKNSLIILIAFQSSYSGTDLSNYIINLAALLFILPFFLFSATAGQIADRFGKADLIRKIKLGEIAIMLFAGAGFYLDSIPLLLFCLFLMGTQSSFFGPIKYSIIPEQLRQRELIGGNALVESGTFMAILLGTMLGGVLVGMAEDARALVSATVIVLAGFGYLSALQIPSTAAVAPSLRVRWNPAVETARNVAALRKYGPVFFSILGISWFWFLGATYLTQMPNFIRLALGANAQVVTFFLALLCVGIGVGSLLCERLSNRSIELGLVPVGSIGLTIFGIDIFFATSMQASGELLGLQEFIRNPSNWRLCADIFLVGLFGGIYIVPLYAMVQARTRAEERARVIAGNNILNAIAMIGSAVYAITLLGAGLSIPVLFLTVALLNAAVALFIFTRVPEFLVRLIVWTSMTAVYRIKTIDLQNLPQQGPLIVLCRPARLLDVLILSSCLQRPMRLFVSPEHLESPLSAYLLRAVDRLADASNPRVSSSAVPVHQQIIRDLDRGDAIGIFAGGSLDPEGLQGYGLADDGQMQTQVAVNVVAIALRKRWPAIELVAEEPVSLESCDVKGLQKAIQGVLVAPGA